MTDSSLNVSVVIPNWNGLAWLPDCLRALREQSYAPFQIIVVDNGSEDGSVAYLNEEHPDIHLIRLDRNRGFAAAANTGIRAADTPYIALLNTDTRAHPDWLRALVATMDSCPPHVGALASCMVTMECPDIMDDAGDYLTWHAGAFKRGHQQPRELFLEETEVFSPCAGAALYRRSFLTQLHGFDERFISYLEDMDLGLRGRLQGFTYRYVPAAMVSHEGHGSGLPSGRYVRYVTRNRLMLMKKSIPARLLFRHAAKLFYGQCYFALATRKPLHALLGWFSLIPCIPHILKERKRIRKSCTLSAEALDALIREDWPEPALRHLVCKRTTNVS